MRIFPRTKSHIRQEPSVSVKSTVKILSIFVALDMNQAVVHALDNMNFTI